MKILITGATGFIGSSLLKHLKLEKNEVFIISRDKNKTKTWVEEYADKIFYGDLNDLEFVKRVISESEAEIIYHLASSAIVRMCARNPVQAYQNNVMGTVNLLEAARICGDSIKKIVVSTSDKVYGHAPSPYDENTPFMPKYTYESTKACQDFVCQNFFHNYNVPIVIARLGNVYGPGDPNDSRLIPKTIMNSLNDISPIIYKDVASYKRDFIYVQDAINALILLAESAPAGEAYCVGSIDKNNVSINEVVNLILKLTGKMDLPIHNPERNNLFKEIENQSLNSKKIIDLGFKHRFTLELGLKETIDFYAKKN